MNRISWDEYFMKLADLASERSTCERRKVGAVIVKNNQILSTGYNGAPKGLPHCDEIGGCLRQKLNVESGKQHELCRAVHAEANALVQCAVKGDNPTGATIYVNTSPCSMCLKLLINAGITRIVTKEHYPDKLSEELLNQSNIIIDFLK